METNDLVFQNGDGNAVTTSLLVAETFGKSHYHVLRDIQEIIDEISKFGRTSISDQLSESKDFAGGVTNFGDTHKYCESDNYKGIAGGIPKFGDTPMFKESSYSHPQNGQEYPMFIMNRDGFALLAMGFTGKKALVFKLRYIEAFNHMEQELHRTVTSVPDDISLKDFAKRVYESECEKEKMSAELMRLKRENVLLKDNCNMIIPRLEKLENMFALSGKKDIPDEQEDKKIVIPPKYKIKISKIRILPAKEIRLKFPDHVTVSEYRNWLAERKVFIKRIDLYAYFRDNCYISKEDSTYNCPTEYSVKNGWMVIAESGTAKAGYVRRYFTPYITPEGKEYFKKELIRIMGDVITLFTNKSKGEVQDEK